MRQQTAIETELITKIRDVISELERQIKELDGRRADLAADLKRHHRMLKLALAEDSGQAGDPPLKD
jgi:hypothetical protein